MTTPVIRRVDQDELLNAVLILRSAGHPQLAAAVKATEELMGLLLKGGNDLLRAAREVYEALQALGVPECDCEDGACEVRRLRTAVTALAECLGPEFGGTEKGEDVEITH